MKRTYKTNKAHLGAVVATTWREIKHKRAGIVDHDGMERAAAAAGSMVCQVGGHQEW